MNTVEANDYNPNVVSSVNMNLLKTSIEQNGFCYPLIVIYDKEREKYIIVDGFHRFKVLKELDADVVPVIILEHGMNERMTATMQFNRAKGTHKIDGDAHIVITLSKNGMSDSDICKYLGMDQDEVLKLKQSAGLKEAFANHEFSKSWDELKEKLKK
jgi:ParB-like chromosome segregation protein Spo0J